MILGGPGDGIVVAQTLRDIERVGGGLRAIGFLNDSLEKNGHVEGLPVLGRLEDWTALSAETLFIAALHKIKEMPRRKRRIEALGVPAERWARVVHPTARIADNVAVGIASFVAAYVVVQPGAMIGSHVSIRAGANVGHDSIVGDFAYIGPNATLCGGARLGGGAHLGPNAVIIDRMTIGEFCVVGAGTVVTKSITAQQIVFGVPARKVGIISMKRC